MRWGSRTLRGIAVQFKQDSCSRSQSDFAKIILIFNASMKQQTSLLWHYFCSDHTANNSSVRFSDVGKMAMNRNRLSFHHTEALLQGRDGSERSRSRSPLLSSLTS